MSKKKAAQKRQQARASQRRTLVLGTLAAALGLAALVYFTRPNTHFDLTGQPVVGPAGAPHTLVVFGDLKCPACRDFQRQSEATIQAVRRSGKLNTVFIHYPFISKAKRLPEDDSRLMARAAECALQMGGAQAHEQVVNTLYALQGPEDLAWGGQDSLGGLLKQAGFSEDQAQNLTRCALEDPQAEAAVQRDEALVRQAKISGTPSLFLDGRRYLNPQQLLQDLNNLQ